MSHSCFNASASTVIADRLITFGITLHRLKFPANERVHMQVSVKVELPAFLIYYARVFKTTTNTSCQPPISQRNSGNIRRGAGLVNIKIFSNGAHLLITFLTVESRHTDKFNREPNFRLLVVVHCTIKFSFVKDLAS